MTECFREIAYYRHINSGSFANASFLHVMIQACIPGISLSLYKYITRCFVPPRSNQFFFRVNR